jgi:hypothetical protein
MRAEAGNNRKGAHMNSRILSAMLCSGVLLAGCGLAETAATGAATGASAAEEAKAGEKMKEDIVSDIDAAKQQSKQALEAAEAEATGE